MTDKGYPFKLIRIEKKTGDPYQIDTLVYAFTSAKSGHQYQVHIERYGEHLNCVKFYDESTDYEKGRFSQLSGTYEPRTIFRTIAEIAFDTLKQDRNASFFFIGATDKKDRSSGKNRRYRVYTAFLKDLGISNMFRPVYLDEQSACILVNTQAVDDIEAYVYRVFTFFTT